MFPKYPRNLLSSVLLITVKKNSHTNGFYRHSLPLGWKSDICPTERKTGSVVSDNIRINTNEESGKGQVLTFHTYLCIWT